MKKLSKNNPSVANATAPFTQGSLWFASPESPSSFLTSPDLIKDNKRKAERLPSRNFYYSIASIASVVTHGLIFVKTNRQQKAFSCGRRWQPKADG